MDKWERFDEKLLPKKEDFYSSLNMEDITVAAMSMQFVKMQKYEKAQVSIMPCMFKVIHYHFQIFLRILEINVLKYMTLILLIFYLHQD